MSWMSEASRLCWQQLGGERVVIIDAGESSTREGISTFVETEGIFSNWMRQNQVSVVIVRPDRYVFAGATNTEELNTSIENLIDEFSSRP
jgi:hypothetical protein